MDNLCVPYSYKIKLTSCHRVACCGSDKRNAKEKPVRWRMAL